MGLLVDWTYPRQESFSLRIFFIIIITSKTEKQRESRLENKIEMCDNCKMHNICIISIPEDKKKTEELFETITTEILLKLMSDIKPQEAERTLSNINTKQQQKQNK